MGRSKGALRCLQSRVSVYRIKNGNTAFWAVSKILVEHALAKCWKSKQESRFTAHGSRPHSRMLGLLRKKGQEDALLVLIHAQHDVCHVVQLSGVVKLLCSCLADNALLPWPLPMH